MIQLSQELAVLCTHPGQFSTGKFSLLNVSSEPEPAEPQGGQGCSFKGLGMDNVQIHTWGARGE